MGLSHRRKTDLLRFCFAILLSSSAYASSIDRIQVTQGASSHLDYLVVQSIDGSLAAGDLFTLYDVSGFSGTIGFSPGTESLWEYRTDLVVPSAPGSLVDNPAIPNVSLRYLGPPTVEPILGFFRIDSDWIEPLSFGIRYTNQLDGSPMYSFGIVRTAIEDITDVPEPASLMLMVPAAALLLFKRQWKRS